LFTFHIPEVFALGIYVYDKNAYCLYHYALQSLVVHCYLFANAIIDEDKWTTLYSDWP